MSARTPSGNDHSGVEPPTFVNAEAAKLEKLYTRQTHLEPPRRRC